ncbi:MAG: ferritin-like domain-containing protein [Limisphaerales bacterium]
MNASLPFPTATSAAPRTAEPIPVRGTLRLVILYALAMAWVEAAVVFYLRTMLDRIVPHQPNPLPVGPGFATAELVREASTLVMLAAVGWLAGRTWRSRTAYALLAFGVWDIGYYVWLVPLTGWPRSLADWDLLFLIPLPWWGPVWAPTAIAALMVAFGVVVTRAEAAGRDVWPGRRAWLAAAAGAGVALHVFMADALRVVADGGRFDALREVLPARFQWPLFTVALGLLATPVAQVAWQACNARKLSLPEELLACWCARLARNQRNRPEPDWAAPVTLRPDVIRPLVRSLEEFQLGDGGGPAGLIAFDTARFRDTSPAQRAVVDAWFAEERGHARLLGKAVQRFGGRRITGHWSFTAFCLVRRLLGVHFELQVLTLTELVSTAYYRLLRRHADDAPLRAMCRLILRDEAGHVAFQRDRIAAGGRRGRAWRAQFWILGHVAAAVLWTSHGRCLRALGGSRTEFFREVRRELRRFVAAVDRAAAEL